MTTEDEGGDRSPTVRPSLFPERQGYRRRRLADAARLLPFLGAALFALPLLWPDAGSGSGPVPLSWAILYIFGIWGILILISVIFGFTVRYLAARDNAGPETD